MSTTTTRKNSKSSVRLFDLTPLESFSGLNLPTNGEILSRFFPLKDQSENKAIQSSFVAKQSHNKLKDLYNKVPVTMKKPVYCVSKICKLYDKWRSV